MINANHILIAVLLIGLATAGQNSGSETNVDPSNVTPSAMEKDAEQVYARFIDVFNGAAIAIGVLMSVLGYRYKKFTFFVIGFIVAGGFALVAVDTLTVGTVYASWAPVTAMVVGGVLVGAMVGCLVKLGIFASGASLGVVLAMMLQSAVLFRVTTLPPNVLMYICMAVFGLLLGLTALKLERPIVILATSFGGSFLAVYGVGHFVGDLPSPFNANEAIEALAARGVDSVPTMWWVYVGIVCGAGLITAAVQHFCTAKKKKTNGVYVGTSSGGDEEYITLEGGLGKPLHGGGSSDYKVIHASSLAYA
jgi:hypothetical protein